MPDDPSQVVYVWFDALANYVTALGYGGGADDVGRWWTSSAHRVHVVGKGILRFHALLWPAILASAGLAGPTTIAAHEYITVGGRKISKSVGNAIDAAALVDRYGADALRWWLLRAVAPVGDTDFTEQALVERANAELANGIANLISRVAALADQTGGVDRPDAVDPDSTPLVERIDDAVARHDLRAATGVLVARVAEVNRQLEREQPWALVRRAETGDAGAGRRREEVLAGAFTVCREITGLLGPFTPSLARRARARLDAAAGGRDVRGVVYPRLA